MDRGSVRSKTSHDPKFEGSNPGNAGIGRIAEKTFFYACKSVSGKY